MTTKAAERKAVRGSGKEYWQRLGNNQVCVIGLKQVLQNW